MAQPAVPLPQKIDKIKVLAAESTRMSSQLLADALMQDSRLEVIAVEPKPASILAAIAHQKSHVVLISSALESSGTQGFELAGQISAAYPNTRIVLLMDTTPSTAVVRAFRSGAHGIFSRTESPKNLAKCICSVHSGQVWANSAELRHLIDALRTPEPMRLVDSGGEAILSKREQDVVQCVAEGLSNREIASRLGLTEHTVKNYLFRIFDKLGISSRVEVVLYVFRHHREGLGSSMGNHGTAGKAGPKLVARAPKTGARIGVPVTVG